MTFTPMTDLYRSIGKSKKCTFIFCADHGVAKMNVSAYPQSVTADMVRNYLVTQGGAANAFAKFAGSELVIVDVGVDADLSDVNGLVDRKIARGTNNIAEGAAMTRAQARKSVKIGKDLVEKAIKAGCNCFLIGEMGIGNTTVASAITSAVLEVSPAKVTGRGSNISDKRYKNKIKIVKQALKVNNPDPDDAIDILAKVGGFEFGAMVGVIIAAAENNCIVVLDGFNTTAAALLADLMMHDAADCLIASHVGREKGHRAALDWLNLTPMFNLDLALGEAIGSSIAVKILDSLVYVYVCDINDDFDGDLSDFKDEEDEEALVKGLMEKIGIADLTQIQSMDDLEHYLEDKLDGEIKIEEIDVDFQIGDDRRFESFEPPFSAQDFNIPRAYPLLIREMGNDNEIVAATDRTFNFYLQTMPKLNFRAMDKCREYIDNLTKPLSSLGLLEDIAVQMAGITGSEIPAAKLRHAAFALTNKENSPANDGRYSLQKRGAARRNLSMDFSMTARTFAMKVFLGLVDQGGDPTVAFSFGRNLAEEISFGIPIIAMTELSDWKKDRLDEKFSRALLKSNGDLKVDPEDFLSYVPQKFRCLTSAFIGAMIAAAHNATLIVVDCGPVEIIARYLEKICPDIRPFLLYSTKLLSPELVSEERIGFDGECACIGTEIVEAALAALNEMKTFGEANVDVAIDGKGAEIQRGDSEDSF